MQRLVKFSPLVFVAVTLLLLAACMPAAAPGGANCQHGICVEVQLSEPIRFNEPVTATVTVKADRDIPKLSIKLAADYSVAVEGTRSWDVDAKTQQPLTFVGTVRFTQEGYFSVIAGAKTTLGEYVADDASVFITRKGGTLNPIVPTGPSQAVPYTPSPSASPLSTPLPLTDSLLSPIIGQSVLVTGENFEGAFPPSGWSTRDLSADGKERFWGKTNYRFASGSWSVWPARNGADGVDPAQSDHNYPDYMDTRLIYGPFDLSDAVIAYTQFQLWREIELDHDYLAVEASHDGVTFQTVISWTGNSTAWSVDTARFNDYVGDGTVWIAWRFYSDST